MIAATLAEDFNIPTVNNRGNNQAGDGGSRHLNNLIDQQDSSNGHSCTFSRTGRVLGHRAKQINRIRNIKITHRSLPSQRKRSWKSVLGRKQKYPQICRS